MVKFFKNYFQMDSFIDRGGYRSHFLHQSVATPQNLQGKKQVCSLFYSLSLYSEKWPKMAMFMRAGKWEGVIPFPPFFFSVDSYGLKSMSFKF